MNDKQLKKQTNNEIVEVNEESASLLLSNEKPIKKKKQKSKARNIFEWIFTGIFGVIFAISAIGQIVGMANAKNHYGQQIRFGYGTFYVLTESMDPVYKKNTAIITYLEDADKVYEKFMANKAYNDTKTNEFIAKHPEALDENGYIISDNADWEAYQKNLKHIDVTFAGVKDAVSSDFHPDDPELTLPAYPNSTKPVPVTHRLREVHVVEGVKKGQGKYIFVAAGINKGAELYDGHQYQAFTEKEMLGTVIFGSNALGVFFGVLSSPWGLLIFLLVPALYLIVTSTIDIVKGIKEPEDTIETNTGETKKVSSLYGISDKDRERLKKELLEEMMKGKNKKE